jgi:hypothetical protein
LGEQSEGQAILVSRWLIVTAVILASQTVEAQQPTTLTLACKGTTTRHNTDGDEDAQPISMGIIVNFTDRTVQGFGPPNGMFDEPLKIGWTNDTKIVSLARRRR